MLRKIYLILFLLALAACKAKQADQNAVQFVTVYPKRNTMHLYYSGNIRPIQQDLIISPANGLVSKLNFNYGDFVKRGDAIFTIHSPEMETEFRQTISNYLKVKQTFLASKKSMLGSEMLYKEKIISEQEFLNEQSSYRNNLLSYIEATTKLQQFLVNLPAYQQKLLNLASLNFDEAKDVLQSKLEDLTINARSSGIILFPEAKSSEAAKELKVGSEIKKNEALLEIGDLTGVAVTANVTENDIKYLCPGISVLMTFASEPELELQGKIVSVAKQAKNAESTGFSTFPVAIQVPKLKPYQLQKLRVGMNAKLDILVEEPASLRVPINAVHQKENLKFIHKLNPVTHKIESVPVETGTTTQFEVTITKGLKQGDVVAIS
jgi:HlyD family secretion protein